MKKWLSVFFKKETPPFLLFLLVWAALTFSLFLVGFFVGLVFSKKFVSPPPVQKKEKQLPPPPRPPQLTSLQNGLFLLWKQGHLIVSRANPGGEIKILRVYKLERDFKRFPKDPNQIAYHGYYFDDISLPSKKALSKKARHFAQLGTKPLYALKYTQEAYQLAEKIASWGGVAILMEYLSPRASSRLRKASALALGKRGYLKSLPVLLNLLKEEDPALRKKILPVLSHLTGLKLPPQIKKSEWQQIEQKVRKWQKKKEK